MTCAAVVCQGEKKGKTGNLILRGKKKGLETPSQTFRKEKRRKGKSSCVSGKREKKGGVLSLFLGPREKEKRLGLLKGTFESTKRKGDPSGGRKDCRVAAKAGGKRKRLLATA